MCRNQLTKEAVPGAGASSPVALTGPAGTYTSATPEALIRAASRPRPATSATLPGPSHNPS